MVISSVQSLSRVQLFVTPWTAARQASLSITNSWSLLKLMFIESVMPSSHLILCRPLLLLPSIFPASGSFQMSQLRIVIAMHYLPFLILTTKSKNVATLISFIWFLYTHNSVLSPKHLT